MCEPELSSIHTGHWSSLLATAGYSPRPRKRVQSSHGAHGAGGSGVGSAVSKLLLAACAVGLEHPVIVAFLCRKNTFLLFSFPFCLYIFFKIVARGSCYSYKNATTDRKRRTNDLVSRFLGTLNIRYEKVHKESGSGKRHSTAWRSVLRAKWLFVCVGLWTHKIYHDRLGDASDATI